MECCVSRVFVTKEKLFYVLGGRCSYFYSFASDVITLSLKVNFSTGRIHIQVQLLYFLEKIGVRFFLHLQSEIRSCVLL